MTEIDRDEWLEELRRFEEAQDEIDVSGVTVNELCERWGKSSKVVRNVLRGLIDEGRIEPVSVRRRELNGVIKGRSGYRLKA